MANQNDRVIVRRNRRGEITRIVEIHTPPRPGAKPPAKGAAGPSSGPRPRVEELPSSDLPALLREMQQQAQKK
jgi:hypothetical protein